MRLRLIASFTLIVLVTIGVVVVVAARQTANEVREFMFRGGMTGSEEFVERLEEYYTENQTWNGAANFLNRLNQKTDKPSGARWGMGNHGGMAAPAMRLVAADGTILADTRGKEQRDTVVGEKLPSSELKQAIELKDGDQTVGYLLPEGNQVFTAQSETILLSRLNRTAIIAVIIAGTIAILLALWLSYHLLRPIHALNQAATHLAQGDLSSRVTVQGSDELATLGRTFNHMAASLQQAENSRRALTADIAHELRTPLAVQRAHLEALQDGIYELSPENLTIIQEQNHMLTRLVDDLRMLALAEAGQLTLEQTPTDFPALIQRVTARLAPVVADRQIELQLALSASCSTLTLDAQRIEQILHILMDNALRYTPDKGQIILQLTCDAHQATLAIRDSGPGIPPEALPHIFERFYRADKSRVRVRDGAESGGTGLGLSIARKLAQAHGGNLTAENHPAGGAEFTLTLPVR